MHLELHIHNLQMVMKWVKAVAYERLLPKNRIKAASATILTFGSYGLGVRASFIILLVDDIVIMTFTLSIIIVIRSIRSSGLSSCVLREVALSCLGRVLFHKNVN